MQIPPALQRNPAAGAASAAGAAAGSAGGQPARFAQAFPALHLGGGRDPRLPLHPGRLLANLLRRQVAGAGNQPFSAQFSVHALFRLLVRASSTSATPASASGCPSSPSHWECRTSRTLPASPSISGARRKKESPHGPNNYPLLPSACRLRRRLMVKVAPMQQPRPDSSASSSSSEKTARGVASTQRQRRTARTTTAPSFKEEPQTAHSL